MMNAFAVRLRDRATLVENLGMRLGEYDLQVCGDSITVGLKDHAHLASIYINGDNSLTVIATIDGATWDNLTETETETVVNSIVISYWKLRKAA